MSIAFARAAFRPSFASWALSPSAICHPTVKTGLRAVDGSWKTIDTSAPRKRRSVDPDTEMTSFSLDPSRLRSTTAPEDVAVSGSRPRMVLAVTVFPEPDSPTMASTSRSPTERLTPSTAFTAPASVENETSRSEIVSTSVMVVRPFRR